MNNNNFFKKHLVTISVIAFLAIVVLIGIFQKKTILKKEAPKGKLPPLEQKLDQPPSLPSSNLKTEPSKLKFKRTQSHFDKIKAYVLSETDDKSLLPNIVSQEEESEINRERNELINSLKKMKQEWNPWIDEYQQKCDDSVREIGKIKDKFPSLKSQQTNLQKNLDDKVQEIDSIKLQLQNKKTQLQTQGKSTYNNSEIKQLQALIEKLQAEKSEIIGEIGKIKVEIANLESDQKSLKKILENNERFKKGLEEKLKYLSEELKGLTISSLQSHYDITSDEG